MRIAFLHAEKARERLLADAFLMGARTHGHETVAIPLAEDLEPGDYDVACMVGVKSARHFYSHRRAGIRVCLFDKGYKRSRASGSVAWEYWRVAIDAHQPTRFLYEQKSPSDRSDALGWDFKPWRKSGSQVVLALSSPKYSAFFDLPEPNEHARVLVKAIRATGCERPITYRPKPSWREAKPVRKTHFSVPPETLTTALDGAQCMVVHGSNACFDAVRLGMPCIVLGDAVARVISSTSLDDIENPRLATEDERSQWLANLAYWQFTEAEFASGEAWDFIGKRVHG
jgi:hypothetical protein